MVFLSKRKRFARGQAVIETLVMLAFGIFILAALTSIVFDQMNANFVSQQKKQGYAVVQSLSKEINDAYFLGPGTVKEVVINFPSFVDLNKSYIGGRALVLNVGGSDLISTADVNVVGAWPNVDGSNVFVITVFSDFVSLVVQKVSFSPAYISMTLAKNSSADFNISVLNFYDTNLSYFVTPRISGSVAVSYLGVNPFVIAEGESSEVSFSVYCDQNSYGSYSGEIIFSPVELGDVNVGVPVRVDCSSVREKLNIYPPTKNISVTRGFSGVYSLLVCNNTPMDFPSSSSSISGAASNYITYSFSGILAANSCRSISLSVVAPIVQGNYTGVLSVNSGGFTATTDINISVNSSCLYFNPVSTIIPPQLSSLTSTANFSLCNLCSDDVNGVSWSRDSNKDANMLTWFTWVPKDLTGNDINSVKKLECKSFDLNITSPIGAAQKYYDANFTTAYSGNSNTAYLYHQVLDYKKNFFFTTENDFNLNENWGESYFSLANSLNRVIPTGELDWNKGIVGIELGPTSTASSLFSDSNLVLLYHLNDKNASNYVLNSATGIYDGQLINGADTNAVGLLNTNAGFFDGNNDYVGVGNIGTVQTISYWVKSDSNSNGGIELNPNQYIDDSAIPEGLVNPTVYIDGVEKVLYGSEVLVNGDMEALGTWSCNSSVSCARSSTVAHQGTYSWKVVTLPTYNGAFESVSLTNDIMYKVSGWSYTESGVKTYISLQRSPGGDFSTAGFPGTAEWSFTRGYGTATSVSGPVFVMFSNNGATTSYFDDVSARPVLIRYPIADSSWHHVVITTGTPISASAVKIGKGGSSYFDGAIDDVAIWKRSLSSAEVLSLYNSYQGRWQDQNLVGYWKFNDKNSSGWILNSATGIRDGQLIGGSDTNAVGLWDTNAGWFNGSTGYAQIPNSSSLNSFSDITLSVWAKPNAFPADNWNPLIGKDPYDNSYLLWLDRRPGGQYLGSLVYVSSVRYDCSYATNLDSLIGTWFNYTMTRASSGAMNVYQNGVLKKTCSSAAGALSSNTNPLVISADKTYGTYFNGSIDEVKIYNRVLSATEIAADYNRFLGAKYVSSVKDLNSSSAYLFNSIRVNSDLNYNFGSELSAGEKFFDQNLVGLWHLNDKNVSGWVLNSATGVRDAELKNGADTNAFGLWDTNAGYFDGVNDFVKANYSGSYSKFSLSAWFKTTGGQTSTYRTIISKQNGNDYLHRNFWFGLSGCTGGTCCLYGSLTILFSVGGVGDVGHACTSVRYDDDKWHYGTATYDGTNVKVYIDGVFAQSNAAGTPDAQIMPTYIGIYSDDVSIPFKGSLDEVAIWNRALSASEVADLYRKSTARLDLNVFSCSDANCVSVVDLNRFTTVQNNVDLNLSSMTGARYFKYVTGFNYSSNIFDVSSAGRIASIGFPLLTDVNFRYYN